MSTIRLKFLKSADIYGVKYLNSMGYLIPTMLIPEVTDENNPWLIFTVHTDYFFYSGIGSVKSGGKYFLESFPHPMRVLEVFEKDCSVLCCIDFRYWRVIKFLWTLEKLLRKKK